MLVLTFSLFRSWGNFYGDVEGDPGWTGQEEVRCGVPWHVQQGQQGMSDDSHTMLRIGIRSDLKLFTVQDQDPDPYRNDLTRRIRICDHHYGLNLFEEKQSEK